MSIATSRERISRWPLLLALGLLVMALGTMLWLRERLVIGQQAELDRAVRLFESTNVLGRPESRAIVFSDIEMNARACESDLITRIYVTKKVHEGSELAVRPFHADLVEPQWRNDPRWTVLAVGGMDPVGYLYIQVDRTTISIVNGAIGLIGVLLASGFTILLLRQRGKEVQLNQTIDELEARKVQVIQLERLALAGQLSANIFHDIKKPVLNIKHEVADALDGHMGHPEDTLRIVQQQTELFLQMLRDLGMESFVNAHQQDLEWCDLQEAVERSLRLVRYEQGDVEPMVEFTGDEAFLILAHPYRLVQLFSNLAMNAFQAMDGSGKLLFSGTVQDGRIIMTIEDSGPGIPKDRRDNVFSPFVTSRANDGGSGLGLYICRTIVDDLKGTIRVEDSKRLGGACFMIDVPRERVSADVSATLEQRPG